MYYGLIDFTVLKTKVSVSPIFFSVLTLVLLMDKTGVAGYAVFFSALHEFGHISALLCGKIFPETVFISIFGIHINLPGNLSTVKKCFVFAAGFAVNFLLAVLFFILKKPLFGYINFIIGMFTALPLTSTDGGAFLKAFFEEFFSQRTENFFGLISNIFSVLISLFLILLSVSSNNYFILIAVVYMLFCTIKTAAG